MDVEITNIKVSIKIHLQSLDSVEDKLRYSSYKYKKYNNFIVFRDRFVYTVFRAGSKVLNHVNITKIKNFNEIEESIISLRDIGLVADRSSMKIDNITGSIDLKKEIHIENLIDSIRTSKDRNFKSIKITYNNEKFPGVFLKQVRVGTIIIFYSGKVVLVGCKTREDLECLASLTHVLTKII